MSLGSILYHYSLGNYQTNPILFYISKILNFQATHAKLYLHPWLNLTKILHALSHTKSSITSSQNCSIIIRRESSCVQAEYQCKDGITCIHRSWVCDGEQDCPEGDDEKPPICQNVTCRADQFQCADKTCIHGRFHCSGKAECKDKSDEINCRKKEVLNR